MREHEYPRQRHTRLADISVLIGGNITRIVNQSTFKSSVLAKAAGVTFETWPDFMSGKRSLTAPQLFRLSKKLNTDISSFFPPAAGIVMPETPTFVICINNQGQPNLEAGKRYQVERMITGSSGKHTHYFKLFGLDQDYAANRFSPTK